MMFSIASREISPGNQNGQDRCRSEKNGCIGHGGITKSAMAKEAKQEVDFQMSSGNVLCGSRVPDAAELDIKVRLAVEIVRVINAAVSRLLRRGC